jgi:hypothetical protein
MLSVKEVDLQNAQLRINELLNNGNVDPEMYTQLEEQLKESVSKVKYERDRAKRLAIKVEDLSLFNKQLSKQIDSLQSPSTYSIDSVRAELSDLKTLNNEILLIVGEMLSQTVGPGFLDMQEKSANRVRINLSKLKTQCTSIIQEILMSRGMVTRLLLWRSDLQYQKTFLTLHIDDLEQSAKAMISFMNNMGVSVDPSFTPLPSTPKQKWKKALNMIIALTRMKYHLINSRKMSRDWKSIVRESKKTFFENHDADLFNGRGVSISPVKFSRSEDFHTPYVPAY